MRKRLGRREGAFDLGRLELPVAIVALVWVLFALFVLASAAHVPVLIVVGLVGVGGLFFLALLILDPDVLETEPGDPLDPVL